MEKGRGMGQQMRGVFLPGDETAVVRTREVPVPGQGQVVIRMGASGICGSDIGFIYRGHKTHKGLEGRPAYRGVVAGHEPAGTIVEQGPGCRRFGLGDRVLVYHIRGCGRCANCRSGYHVSCAVPTEREAYGWQRDGGHADYVLVDEESCVPLPEPLSFVDGALIACGFGTAYEGLCRADIRGGDDLVVVGMGPVGLAAAMIGRVLGARRVIGVEPGEARRAFARWTGLVDDVLEANAETVEEIMRLTDGAGARVSIDASGASSGRSVALGAAAEWGRVGLIGEGGSLETEVSDAILHKHLTITGSWVTSLQGMERVADLMAARGLHPEVVVSDRYSLDDADAAYRAAAGGAAGKVVFVPDQAGG